MAASRVIPWSYSSLSAFMECPRRFYLTRITKKVKESAGEALLEGRRVHKALEDAVGGVKALPEHYRQHQGIVDKLRATKGQRLLEYKFGITSALTPTDYWSKDAWARGVLDVGIVRPAEAILLDYKTGKRRPDSDQLRMFAMAALALWPHVEQVKTGYIWLQSQQIDTEAFTPEDKAEIQQDFAARVHRMEAADKNDDWPPRPSGLCRNWCPVGKANCEHCGS